VRCILLAGVALLAGSAHGQTPREQAHELMRGGISCFAGGDYRCALDRFERAYRLLPSHRLVFNLARALEALGRDCAAAERFEEFLEQEASLAEPQMIAAARRRLGTLGKRLARVRVTVDGKGASVTIDGQPLGTTPFRRWRCYTSPGEHRVRVTAPGRKPIVQRISLSLGEAERVRIELPRRDEPSPAVTVHAPAPPHPPRAPRVSRRWLWFAGLSAAAFAACGVTGGLALRDNREWENGPKLDDTPRTRGQTLQKVSNVLIAAGGTLAAISAVVLFVDVREARRARVGLAPLPSGAALVIGGEL
jgi:tetratricopeptide (TPR) repeat protein